MDNKFDKYYIGQIAKISKKFTKESVEEFSKLSGDFNPIHIDEDFAKDTQFGRCIVHGTFYTAIIGTVLGTELPGVGTILLSQEHKFIRPVYVEDTITAILTIIDIDIEKKNIKLSISCTNQNEEEVLKGFTTVKKLY